MTAPYFLDIVGLSGQAHSDSVRLNGGIRYSVLPALTIDGFLTVRGIEGSTIDGAEFYDFVVNDLPNMNSRAKTFGIDWRLTLTRQCI
ncbi:hypothetical protein C8R48DRAFT_727809 [Suillus tomentosus]|nr:hypothetical protein C8R48DRAFT_727809 [Suillus tomentosus]